MEGISIILIIVLFFLINRLIKKVDGIDRKMDDFLKQTRPSEESQSQHTHPQESKPEVKPIDSITIIKERISPPLEEKKETEDLLSPELLDTVMADSQEHSITREPPKKVKPKAPPKPSFMERNPDLEKFIGEDLLPKIGIVIFVIGMGFLVKLGIDNEVISESMRVAIGILIGGGMIGLAHYLRNSFASFSSILIGGALAVLYFTIALAFHEYALIPQTAAFVIMVFITVFGVLLSIAYDRKELAVLAIIGGFGTPFFVSTGSGNFSVLLTYILILDIGMLTLVYFKKWNIVNYLVYGFTYVLFAGVYASKFIGNEDATRWPLFLFLTSFYLIFFLMTIIYNVKNAKKFKYPEILMLLSNSGIYFGLGLSLVHGYKGGLYSGIFAALTAIFNFGFAFTLYKRKDIDKNLLFLLIGLVLTFVSLIAPIQLKGNYITLFWAIEAVLLMWLSQKSGIKVMKLASAVISVLMLISLSMDWQQNYAPTYSYIVLDLFLNKMFITSIVVIASLLGMIRLLKQGEVIHIRNSEFLWKGLYVKVVFAIVLYLGILLELNYQLIRFEFYSTYRVVLLGIYNYAFVIAVLAANRLNPSGLLGKVGFWLSSLAVFSYLTVYLENIVASRSYYLINDGVVTGYSWHNVQLALFLVILVSLYLDIHKKYSFQSKKGTIALWILAFIGVFISSAEISHISVLYQLGADRADYEAYDIAVRSVFPVVWALSALTMMILGMKFRLKTLRIASLGLFSITIVKLFFYDLAGNSTGKIISFILLGVILLLISFLYQKLKFIIQDDDENKA